MLSISSVVPRGSTIPSGRLGFPLKPEDGPYTEGKDGIITEVGGLGFVPESEGVCGRSGVSEIDALGLIDPDGLRDVDNDVRSRLCARVVSERGLELCANFSRIFASINESEPRFGSSTTRDAGGMLRCTAIPRVTVGVPFQ